MKPSLIVHGGAWDIPDEAVEACKSGCHRALTAGWSILAGGGSALDAVEAAIIVLEDEPVFDAGFGSHLNLDGRVECDAIVMDGATLRAGAAAALQRIRNPIRLARVVLEKFPHLFNEEERGRVAPDRTEDRLGQRIEEVRHTVRDAKKRLAVTRWPTRADRTVRGQCREDFFDPGRVEGRKIDASTTFQGSG